MENGEMGDRERVEFLLRVIYTSVRRSFGSTCIAGLGRRPIHLAPRSSGELSDAYRPVAFTLQYGWSKATVLWKFTQKPIYIWSCTCICSSRKNAKCSAWQNVEFINTSQRPSAIALQQQQRLFIQCIHCNVIKKYAYSIHSSLAVSGRYWKAQVAACC